MIEQLDARVNVIIIEHLVGPIDFKTRYFSCQSVRHSYSRKLNLMLSIYILLKLNGRTNCEVHFEIERHTRSFYCMHGSYRGC